MKDLELREVFAANLRNILKEKKMTQKQLGERILRSGEQVSRWVNAKTSPSWEHLCLISEALSIGVPELLSARQINPVFYQPALNFTPDAEYVMFKKFREFERIFAS